MQAHRLLTGFLLTLGTVVPLGACSNSDSYVIVTVAARPAVHDAKALTVGLTNAGTTRMDSLVLRDQVFPVTFSISTPGRTGDLAIAVDATDENGLVVGHGTATTTVAVPDASVQLESTDFVVNTDYANDQFPADFSEAGGFQLAALPDGTWTAVFRDSCMQNACNVFARRFSSAGKPVTTQAAAGTNAFVVTARPSDLFTEPAVASSQTATVAMWNFDDAAPATTTGVACRTINTTGALGADQTTISNDTIVDAVSVVALPSGDFVASWNAIPAGSTSNVIREAIIKPDCTVVGAVQTISMAATTDFPHRGAVASSADHVLFAWIVDGNLHTRLASNLGLPTTNDTVLVPKTATEEIFHVRVAGVASGGFVIAARWAQSSLVSGPGRIELFRINAAGALVGAPTLITDKTDTDFDNREAFSIAGRPDGTLLLAWHTCGTLGDDHMCGVFGRIVRDTGDPVTDVFVIPTTTEGDQKLPSVVGLPDAFVVMWTDVSMKPPDIAGSSVRARLVYLPGVPGPPGK